MGGRVVAVPAPPEPLDALDHLLVAGTLIHRVHSVARDADAFNPGRGSRTRFAPIRDPKIVPTLYAAETADAAICETLLHDVPLTGDRLLLDAYRFTRESTLEATRDLRLAKFMGDGLRRLGVDASQLTGTGAGDYGKTAAWAVAAHRAGFDGIAWMSPRENTAAAYLLFGDRVGVRDVRLAPHGLGPFTPPAPGFDWLSTYCARVGVDVLLA